MLILSPPESLHAPSWHLTLYLSHANSISWNKIALFYPMLRITGGTSIIFFVIFKKNNQTSDLQLTSFFSAEFYVEMTRVCHRTSVAVDVETGLW